MADVMRGVFHCDAHFGYVIPSGGEVCLDSDVRHSTLWHPPTDPVSEEDTEDPITCDGWFYDVAVSPTVRQSPVSRIVLLGFVAFFVVFFAVVAWLL